MSVPRSGRPPASHGAAALQAVQLAQELYEEGAVSVREIARLAGVTERMIYKYAQTGGWQRRRPAAGAAMLGSERVQKALSAAADKARAAAEVARADAKKRVAQVKALRMREANLRMQREEERRMQKEQREAEIAERQKRRANANALYILSVALGDLTATMADATEKPITFVRTLPFAEKLLDEIDRQVATLTPPT
jgi:hypothetical protein